MLQCVVLVLLCYSASLGRSRHFRMMGMASPVSERNGNASPNNGDTFQPDFFDHCGGNEERLCPPWYFCNASRCNGGSDSHDNVKCDDMGHTYVLDCSCVTFDKYTNSSELGHCIFNCENNGYDEKDNIYHQLPANVSQLNDVMCGDKFNRQGSLCGSCKEDYYPLAYSYDLSCVKCDNSRYNWLKYLLLAYLPLTIFYFIVLFFRISVLHSHLHGFVMYSQAVTFPLMCRIAVLAYNKNPLVYTMIKIVGTLYGVWNLDFMRLFDNAICLKASILLVNTLDLAVGLYPLLLIFMTYVCVNLYEKNIGPGVVLVKPIYALFIVLKKRFEIRTSLVDAFTTFLFLTNVKLLSVSFDTLAPVKVHILDMSGRSSSTYKLYFDTTVSYFGEQHVVYATLCLSLVFLFVIFPALILALYPFRFFQRYLNKFPHQLLIFIHTYVDIIYGCYKDGTEPGTKDCRWFATLLVFIRIFLFVLYGFTLNIMYFVLGTMALLLICIVLIIVEPFKDGTKHNMLTTSFMLYLTGLYVSVLGSDVAGVKSPGLVPMYHMFFVVFAITPLFYVTFLAFSWPIGRKFMHRIVRWMKLQTQRCE